MSDVVLELKRHLQEVEDLKSINNLLEWDQATYMPEQGAASRGRQMALIGKLEHQRRSSESLARLLSEAEKSVKANSVDEAIVHKARREYERAKRLPTELVSDLKEHTAKTYVAWTKARPRNDFKLLVPLLKKSVEFTHRIAEYFPDAEHPIDVHIDRHDPGMNAANVRSLFASLRAELQPFAEKLFAQALPERDFLYAKYPVQKQLAFGEEVATILGYDRKRGRQDLTHHPFMIRFAAGDIRITTRVKEHDLGDSLFSTIHETGHALYELGIDDAFDGTPLGAGVSAGIHESQSRLWENQIGRSRHFWKGLFPTLQAHFPEQLANVDAGSFYRAINAVEPSLIRTESDEVSYNLHVMLRFDLELAMLEGKLNVEELSDAWDARIEEDFGIKPDSKANGVLQDVHWYCEPIGGTFQGYTIGNLFAAQLMEVLRRDLPTLDRDVESLNFTPLECYLRDKLYRHGSRYLPNDLIEMTTGKSLEIAPFMRYLRAKFGTLYNVE